jgi:hypothetical protein
LTEFFSDPFSMFAPEATPTTGNFKIIFSLTTKKEEVEVPRDSPLADLPGLFFYLAKNI